MQRRWNYEWYLLQFLGWILFESLLTSVIGWRHLPWFMAQLHPIHLWKSFHPGGSLILGGNPFQTPEHQFDPPRTNFADLNQQSAPCLLVMVDLESWELHVFGYYVPGNDDWRARSDEKLRHSDSYSPNHRSIACFRMLAYIVVPINHLPMFSTDRTTEIFASTLFPCLFVWSLLIEQKFDKCLLF